MTTLNVLNSHAVDATLSNLQHLQCERVVGGRVRLVAGDDRLRPRHDPRIGAETSGGARCLT
jgi:hypothetical protein